MLNLSGRGLSHYTIKSAIVTLVGVIQIPISTASFSQEKSESVEIKELEFDVSPPNTKYRNFSILDISEINKDKNKKSGTTFENNEKIEENFEKKSFDIIEDKEGQYSEGDKQIHHPDFEEYLKKEKIKKWKSVGRLERLYQFTNIMDLAQTIRFIKNPRWSEANPLLGSRPSSSKLIAFKLGTGAAHFAVTKLLFKADPKMAKTWAITSLTVQGGVVLWNVQTFFK